MKLTLVAPSGARIDFLVPDETIPTNRCLSRHEAIQLLKTPGVGYEVIHPNGMKVSIPDKHKALGQVLIGNATVDICQSFVRGIGLDDENFTVSRSMHSQGNHRIKHIKVPKDEVFTYNQAKIVKSFVNFVLACSKQTLPPGVPSLLDIQHPPVPHPSTESIPVAPPPPPILGSSCPPVTTSVSAVSSEACDGSEETGDIEPISRPPVDTHATKKGVLTGIFLSALAAVSFAVAAIGVVLLPIPILGGLLIAFGLASGIVVSVGAGKVFRETYQRHHSEV